MDDSRLAFDGSRMARDAWLSERLRSWLRAHNQPRALSCVALCMMAHACSLELPSTGPGLSDSFDAAIALPETGGRVASESGRKEAIDDAQVVSAKEAGLQPAADQRDAAVITALVDANAATNGCVLDGRFALRIAFDVTWTGSEFASIVPIIEPGEGELSITALLELKSTADGLATQYRTCATEVPEFVAGISRERYQARFEDMVWDARSMPTFATTLRADCREPGCRILGEPLYALIGSMLPSTTEPWPLDADAGVWPDHDADGEPGIAVSMLGPEQGTYAYPPLDLLAIRRVRSLGLGLRAIVGLEGAIDSCDALHGATREGRIETRAASCQAMSGQGAYASARCEPRELMFLNQNLPAWTVRQGSFQAKRVPLDGDCRAVRRVFPRTKSDTR